MLDWRPWPQFSSTRLPTVIATTTKNWFILSLCLPESSANNMQGAQQCLYVEEHSTTMRILCKPGPQVVLMEFSPIPIPGADAWIFQYYSIADTVIATHTLTEVQRLLTWEEDVLNFPFSLQSPLSANKLAVLLVPFQDGIWGPTFTPGYIQAVSWIPGQSSDPKQQRAPKQPRICELW